MTTTTAQTAPAQTAPAPTPPGVAPTEPSAGAPTPRRWRAVLRVLRWRNTPERIRGLTALTAVLAIALGVITAAIFSSVNSGVRDIGGRADPEVNHATDLYLHLGRDLSPSDRTIEIQSDHPTELFLPDGPLVSLPIGSNRILVRVPAYSATESVYLGRVISATPVKFEVLTP